jgi:hypothetical protein
MAKAGISADFEILWGKASRQAELAKWTRQAELAGPPPHPDELLVVEMHRALTAGLVIKSVWAATDLVVDRALGGGSRESKRTRLAKRYRSVFPSHGAPAGR